MSEFDNVLADKEEEDEDLVAAMLDLKKKKKKKKVKTEERSDETSGAGTEGLVSAVVEIDPPPYSYPQLLQRVVDFLHQNNPELAEKKRATIKPPNILRHGTKKTLWSNFQEICKMMNRSPDHVFQFMMAELGTEGSIDGNQRLVIKGKFVPKYIESLLRKYIIEYVSCQMCRSLQTSLNRDNNTRLYFVECRDCNSSRSVAQIRAGFHAQTRADRRALRK